MWQYSDQWAAGFFDGDGCVSIRRRRRGNCVDHAVYAQVTQKDPSPLRAFQNEFGGSISPTKTPSGCYRWRVAGRKAERFLRRIQTYSLVKAEPIRLALELRDSMLLPGQRHIDRDAVVEWRERLRHFVKVCNAA